MKKITNPKRIGRLIVIFSCIVLLISMICLTGCETVKEPEKDGQVYSINLQYNGTNVDGQLSVDLSMKTLSLAAKIMQDGYETATYKSSNESVATISSNGMVKLCSAGETAITATAGNKSHSIILIVSDDYTESASYTITVSGGVAKNESGEIITSAGAGDYITLVPAMPAHKDFVEWQFNEIDLWRNGNLIKMPAANLTVTAEYTDTLYILNLIGASVTKANLEENPEGVTLGGSNVENIKTVYKFTYGTSLTIKANSPANTRLFVGWDQNIENNRVGYDGVSEYTFDMVGAETTITAVFSDIEHNIIPGYVVSEYSGKLLSKFDESHLPGVSAKKIAAGVIEGEILADPDLESLYGYSFAIPANMQGSAKDNECIYKTSLNTVDTLEPMTFKIIFKNRGNYPVTVELGYSYFGNVASTGAVTVPAGETVISYFKSNIGLKESSWSFAIRENVGGNAGEVVNLDVVAAGARTYPGGYPLLNIEEDVEYMNFDSILQTNSGWSSGGNRFICNEKGAQIFVSRASNMNDSKASVYAKVTNLPDYDPANPVTNIYVRVLNLVNSISNPRNKFAIIFSNSSNAFDENAVVLGAVEVDLREPSEIALLKIELERSDNEGDIYMHLVKTEKESGMDYNVLTQFAYDNVFGYQEEN